MSSYPKKIAPVLAGLLLLVLLVVGLRQGQGLEYVNEPLRGHLDLQVSDFRPDGLTHVKGWVYHAVGVRSVQLVIDEARRLPMKLGVERQDVAAAFPGRPRPPACALHRAGA